MASAILNARRFSYRASVRSGSTSLSSDTYYASTLSQTARRTLRRLASFHRGDPRSVRFLSKRVSSPLLRREQSNVTVPPNGAFCSAWARAAGQTRASICAPARRDCPRPSASDHASDRKFWCGNHILSIKCHTRLRLQPKVIGMRGQMGLPRKSCSIWKKASKQSILGPANYCS